MGAGSILLFLFLFIPLLGIFIHREPIEADTLIVSPFIILAVSVLFDKLMGFRFLKIFSIILLTFISFANSYFLFTNYLTTNGSRQFTFSKHLQAIDSVIHIAKRRDYNLLGKGVLSNFPVFTMPYEYLLWWKGYPPKKENTDLKIVVWEKDGEIIVYKK